MLRLSLYGRSAAAKMAPAYKQDINALGYHRWRSDKNESENMRKVSALLPRPLMRELARQEQRPRVKHRHERRNA